ncbi:MAG TPA: hypothetical protein VGH73_02705 [Thermoanaerobaculia bacterium]|jgi:hypothetical protein
MEDHRLGDLLRELPREPARPGFTAGVLRRIAVPERRQRRLSPRVALAGALALTLTVAAGALVEARREAIETARTRQALQDIRAEHGRLEREVEELSQPSVVYLGGNENVDLVLDLGKARGTEGAKPAAYHGETF